MSASTGRTRSRGPAALALIELVVDTGSFRSWDVPVPVAAARGSAYAAELQSARARTGLDESVVTGEGTVRGRRVALLISEFGFLAGSIGLDAADRLVSAIERATRLGLPILAAPTSGGTRMQEGTLAFVQMARIAAAVHAHKAAGHPYLVYLRHPTTGGVFASWGSLGQVTVAEPGALVGFLGPRVYEALHGRPFPPAVQTSENLARHGVVDAVLPPHRLAKNIAQILDVVYANAERWPGPGRAALTGRGLEAEEERPGDVWESVCRTRDPARPGLRDLLQHGATTWVPTGGTGAGERDPGVLVGLARFGGVGCVVLGHDRRATNAAAGFGPAGLRQARRGMQLATELGLPLVSVIDTHGAALSPGAEEGGMAGEIARCLAELTTLGGPTVSVLMGEGTGGGALAILPADRVLAARHAWLAPLPPEGASAIVHRDTDHAPEMAEAQGIGAGRLLAEGVVDELVEERPDAAREPAEFCRRLAGRVEAVLGGLLDGSITPRERVGRGPVPVFARSGLAQDRVATAFEGSSAAGPG